jgi:hypothetical protein
MTILGLIGIAAAAFALQQAEPMQADVPQPAPDQARQVTPASVGDALMKNMFSEPAEREPRYLYGLVRTEKRDPAWADRAEASLRERYGPLSSAGKLQGLRITCAATVCEVAALIRGKPRKDHDETVEKLQSPPLTNDISSVGVKQQGGIFGPAPDSDGSVFARYWLRSKG